MKELEPLIDQAEREGKWLHCGYYDFALSPRELREANAKGKYRWGPINWTLIDPKSLLRDEERELAEIRRRNANIQERMGK